MATSADNERYFLELKHNFIRANYFDFKYFFSSFLVPVQEVGLLLLLKEHNQVKSVTNSGFECIGWNFLIERKLVLNIKTLVFMIFFSFNFSRKSLTNVCPQT